MRTKEFKAKLRKAAYNKWFNMEVEEKSIFDFSKNIAIFVESKDDATFYEKAFKAKYQFNKMIFKCCGDCESVIRQSRNKEKNKIYIIDKDYVYRKSKDIENLVITTGYSMENYFFYKDDYIFNLQTLFYSLLGRRSDVSNLLDNFIDKINDFVDYRLEYYAFMKTCIELKYNFHKRVYTFIKTYENEYRDYNEVIDELIDTIELEINRIHFYNKFMSNIDIVKENKYLLIRGHDLFDLLISFFKKNNINKNVNSILEVSNEITLPKSFIDDLEEKF